MKYFVHRNFYSVEKESLKFRVRRRRRASQKIRCRENPPTGCYGEEGERVRKREKEREVVRGRMCAN